MNKLSAFAVLPHAGVAQRHHPPVRVHSSSAHAHMCACIHVTHRRAVFTPLFSIIFALSRSHVALSRRRVRGLIYSRRFMSAPYRRAICSLTLSPSPSRQRLSFATSATVRDPLSRLYISHRTKFEYTTDTGWRCDGPNFKNRPVRNLSAKPPLGGGSPMRVGFPLHGVLIIRSRCSLGRELARRDRSTSLESHY